MSFKSFNITDLNTREVQAILTSAIAPRPIAFASTVDANGVPNLSPFSFFNAFGANPPVMIFSPARSGRDNTTKHTYDNVKDVPEVVINVVNHEMVEQMSLASSNYAKGVNEFDKAGFTMIGSDMIQPPRVKESPVQFECKVQDVIETGEEGGAGNLVICHVVKVHINENAYNADGKLDSQLLDLVGRMGGDDYIRTSQALFTIPKPTSTIGVGVDALPEFIRTSPFLTGRDLARLGSLEKLPDSLKTVKMEIGKTSKLEFDKAIEFIEDGQVWEALCYLCNLEE